MKTRFIYLSVYCSTGDLIWDLVLARQALYHVNYISSLFTLVFFFQIGPCFYAGASLIQDPPTYTSSIAGMIGACHYTQIIG
jgi:hypothetical protein